MPLRAIQAVVAPTVRRSSARVASARPTASRWARRRSGIEAVEREPEREKGDGDVVEPAEHGDDVGHEIDGADDIAGGRDDGGAAGAAEHRVLAQAPREPQVVGHAMGHRGDPFTGEWVGRLVDVVGVGRREVVGHGDHPRLPRWRAAPGAAAGIVG